MLNRKKRQKIQNKVYKCAKIEKNKQSCQVF